jgi:hypothetical protein
MENTVFKRGIDPKDALGIGVEYFRRKKLEAIRNQKYEEAAKWRDKEKEFLANENKTNG